LQPIAKLPYGSYRDSRLRNPGPGDFEHQVDAASCSVNLSSSFSTVVDMIVRSVARCSARLRPSICRSKASVTVQHQIRPRRYSTSPGAAGATPSSPAAMLAPLVGDLDKIAPSFSIDGSKIKVLKTPTEFYETLKVRALAFSVLAQVNIVVGQDTKC